MLRAGLTLLLILGSMIKPISTSEHGTSFSFISTHSVYTQDDRKPSSIPNPAYCENLNQFNPASAIALTLPNFFNSARQCPARWGRCD